MAIFRTLISANDLSGIYLDSSTVVIDARFSLADPSLGRRQFAEGHIPGAQYADLDNDLAAPVTESTGRHPLPEPGAFVERLRDWGVRNSSQVVVYDDASGGIAARLWWMLRWVGHEATALLDGGLRAWQDAGLPVDAVIERTDRGDFSGQANENKVISAEELEAALQTGGVTLIDARDGARFRGEQEPIDSKAGHVPGARNMPFAGNLADTGEWLPPESLEARWNGIAASDAVVMCGSGVTACHLALAAVHAGLAEPRLYPGSWSEWIRDERRPIETG